MNSSFLSLSDCMLIHEDMIHQYGGSTGLRDIGLLESALAQPCAEFSGTLLHSSVPEQAAAYLYHVLKNHAFVDGNKRTALACALVFLEINGYELDPSLDYPPSNKLPSFSSDTSEADQTILEKVVIDVASNFISKEELITFFKQHTKQIFQ